MRCHHKGRNFKSGRSVLLKLNYAIIESVGASVSESLEENLDIDSSRNFMPVLNG